MSTLWKGNHAVVEGALAGGVDAYFGYPITPQNEITEYMSVRIRQEGRVFLQSESELASINMVFGGALTGKKVMTSSSSPGISLMQEGISYMAGCELPGVIVNVQRGGPGLGNISGAQGDYFQATKGGGHGDYRLIVYTPSTVQELYEMTRDAFDVSIKYRTPAMILADGVLGQMMEPAEIEKADSKNYDSGELPDRGWNLTGAKDRDSRFIRSLYMGENELEDLNYRIFERYDNFSHLVDWEEKEVEDADIILAGYGISARINLDAFIKARDKGLKVGYFRFKTVYPFPKKRINQLTENSKILVVEMSMGQLVDDVKLAARNNENVEFYGRPAGGIPQVDNIIQKIEEML
ncbi:MAG: 3-methyl-2-oxobutanoate dehydrogenase subunit VorB [Elusimicrobiota bacterium]